MNAGGAGGDIAHLPEAQQPERAGPQHTQVAQFEARKFEKHDPLKLTELLRSSLFCPLVQVYSSKKVAGKDIVNINKNPASQNISACKAPIGIIWLW